jgi:hypothetical protein
MLWHRRSCGGGLVPVQKLGSSTAHCHPPAIRGIDQAMKSFGSPPVLRSLWYRFLQVCDVLDIDVRHVLLLLLAAFLAGFAWDAVVHHLATGRVPFYRHR